MPFAKGMRVHAKATSFDEKTGPKWSEAVFGCHSTTATIVGTIVADKTPQSKWPVVWDLDGKQHAMREDQIWPDASGAQPDVELCDDIEDDGLFSCGILPYFCCIFCAPTGACDFVYWCLFSELGGEGDPC
jgi:hypothetical protein